MISVSNNWENNLRRPIKRSQVITLVFGITASSMSWLVGPLGFEPRTNGL